MRLADPVLYPFALLYEGITRLRNRMFDLGMKKGVSFMVPTIVVGNLSMGGTGKTPMVEYLIKHLKEKYQIATLSRGYGRTTTGFLTVKEESSAREVGDEPYQIYQKFGKEILVAVGEERILAIPKILADQPEINLILLDDAFQHRYVKGDLNILLTTFQLPFFRDRVIPQGSLREHPKGAQRADAILVTKCPDNLDHNTKNEYKKNIQVYSGKECPVIFAHLKYGLPYGVFNKELKIDQNVILLSGIADNQLLKAEVSKNHSLLEVFEFADHHRYSEKDMIKLRSVYKKFENTGCSVITTEKDAVKLKEGKFWKYLKDIPIFALPVEIWIDPTEEKSLLNLTAKAIAKAKENNSEG